MAISNNDLEQMDKRYWCIQRKTEPGVKKEELESVGSQKARPSAHASKEKKKQALEDEIRKR